MKPGRWRARASALANVATSASLGYSARAFRGKRAARTNGGFFENPDRACTDGIMACTIGAYAMQVLSQQALTAVGAKANAAIAAGEVWRLFTPIFLHGGLSHLMVNMYSLNSIGPMMEATFGREQFLAVYFGSGVVGNYASYRFCAANSVGASGSIFGLAGALAVYLHRHRPYLGERADQQLQSLGTALAVNTLFGLTSRRVDNWGHGGGLVGGAILAYLNGPNLKLEPDGEALGKLGKGKLATRRRKLVNRPVLASAIESVKKLWDDDDDDDDNA